MNKIKCCAPKVLREIQTRKSTIKFGLSRNVCTNTEAAEDIIKGSVIRINTKKEVKKYRPSFCFKDPK